jgi:ribonuclease R
MNEKKQLIIDFMREEAYKPLLIEELAMVLSVPKEEKVIFHKLIKELEDEGKIFKNKKSRYGVLERMNLIAGRIQGHERGYAFLVPDDKEEGDVFIPGENLNGAIHNDRVIVRYTNNASTSKRAEGEVIRFLLRANHTIVGKLEVSKTFGFLIPDNAKISTDIFIAKNDFKGAKDGDKVIVEIIEWSGKRRNPEGKVIEILGSSKDPNIEIISIIKSYDLDESFPPDVEAEIENIPTEIKDEDIKNRRDLRNLRMFTIDGEDAKDLDDAVSIENIPNGYRLGVHIADVTEYVREGTFLDQEAVKRGTSVYLVDRVIPMLPRKLSNGICSLNPQVNRYAFSVFMDIDKNGMVFNSEFVESVIKTDERMTYTNVYRILEDEDNELITRYKNIVPDLKKMKELAMILRKKRMDRGAIDFDFKESKILLDEQGEPIEIKKYDYNIANQVIEECMLVCNETVSEHFFWTGTPFVYRVHEEPDPERIETFAKLIANMGYSLKGSNKVHSGALQKIIENVKGKSEEKIISTIMLRSLKKARYTNKNDIHFGLAAKFYSHFTSPIRRYPDLIIHRIMKEVLHGKMSKKRIEHYNDILPDICGQCSDREKVAEDAERDTVDLKKVQYMKKYVGYSMKGFISSVTAFGMFVEFENSIEGLVRISNLEDDYYIYNNEQYALIGERTNRVYRIGDEVDVIIASANTKTRQIELLMDYRKEIMENMNEEERKYFEDYSQTEHYIKDIIRANIKKNKKHRKRNDEKNKGKSKDNDGSVKTDKDKKSTTGLKKVVKSNTGSSEKKNRRNIKSRKSRKRK